MEQMTVSLFLSYRLDGSGGLRVLQALERSESLGICSSLPHLSIHSCSGKGGDRRHPGGSSGLHVYYTPCPHWVTATLPIRTDSPALMVSPLLTCRALDIRSPNPLAADTPAVSSGKNIPTGRPGPPTQQSPERQNQEAQDVPVGLCK